MEGWALKISSRCGVLVLVAALCGVGGTVLPSPGAAAFLAADEITDLEGRVKELEAGLERLYLELEQAHAQARKGAYLQAVGNLEPALSTLVAEARTDAERPASALAAEAIATLTRARPARRGNNVLALVLTDTAEAARRDPKTSPAALLAASAEAFFAPTEVVDIWDSRLGVHPEVRSFRTANESLSAARRRSLEPTGPQPGDPGTEGDMVLFPRSRGYVGPWIGWVQDLDEKQNRRQAATRKPIYVDRYEVSCAQYLAFLVAQKRNKHKELLPAAWTLDEDDEIEFPSGHARHPVTGLTFKQALAYAKYWGKRLPTENEWELCAAGTSKEGRAFPWGLAAGDTAFAVKGRVDRTSEVGAFPEDSTPEGVVGFAGNVAEFVATLPDRSDLPRGRTPKSGDEVVVRGGSFKSSPDECSTAYRWTADPEVGHRTVGLRCVMDALDYKRKFGK
jgi:formylglycine-generating enzyme required for sulfatase activity